MLLTGKNAVIYGAGGSIGGAVAKALAGQGAMVFLTGRNLSSLDNVLSEILASGGLAQADQVDAMDGTAISLHLERVLDKAGTIDISFNAIGIKAVQDITLVNMPVEDFLRPVNIAMQTLFLTATAAGRLMMKQRTGVILTLTATPGGIGYPLTGGFAPACCAIEGFSRNLASELGVFGVRVVNIRSGGSPDSAVFKQAIESHPAVMEPVLRKMKDDTMLKRLPLMADITNIAVFLVSDLSGSITGVTIDATCGTTAGLNYRMDKAAL